MSEDRRSPTRTPRTSTRFCLLHVEHNLQWVFLSIVWYHQSSDFLDVCFRQWYHVGYVCIDNQLGLHGRSRAYCSFLRLTSARKRHIYVGCSSSIIELLVLCSLQLIRITLLYMSISKAFSLLLTADLIVQVSHPYIATDQTKVNYSWLIWSHRYFGFLCVDLQAVLVLFSAFEVLHIKRYINLRLNYLGVWLAWTVDSDA